MNEKIPSNFGAVTNFTYNTMFPSTPVMVNWHNAHNCMLPQVKPQWLVRGGSCQYLIHNDECVEDASNMYNCSQVDAALHINPKLKLNPKNHEIALFAITRLDISNNALVVIPPMIFQLQSLR